MSTILGQTAVRTLFNTRSTSLLDGKSVLLTGATGLIGTNLYYALNRTGIDGLYAPGHGTITPSGTFDYIIHCAGYAQPAKFLADPYGTVAANTEVLIDLIHHLAPGGRLVFLSTSEIYTGNPRDFHRECDFGTSTPSQPRGIYTESKRCGEAICHAARAKGKTAIIARVSLAYGPGARRGDKRVMSEIIDAGILYRHIELKDGGAARRIYCYVSDVCGMLLNILLYGQHAIYNVGGEGEITIGSLAKKVGDILKVPVVVPRKMVTSQAGSPAHVGLDMSRYMNEFGPINYVPLDEGLRQTIAWHKELEGEKVAA